MEKNTIEENWLTKSYSIAYKALLNAKMSVSEFSILFNNIFDINYIEGKTVNRLLRENGILKYYNGQEYVYYKYESFSEKLNKTDKNGVKYSFYIWDVKILLAVFGISLFKEFTKKDLNNVNSILARFSNKKPNAKIALKNFKEFQSFLNTLANVA